MSNLLDTFLNLLGYYNLTASEFFDYYGAYYYIPSRQQLYKQIEMTDQVLVDVVSAEITREIQNQLNTTNISYEITYDFYSTFTTNNTPVLQQERVIDSILNDLETKGYRVYETEIPTKYVIRWKFKKFRMFQRLNVGIPPNG